VCTSINVIMMRFIFYVHFKAAKKAFLDGFIQFITQFALV
jgi:hypothetical protein